MYIVAGSANEAFIRVLEELKGAPECAPRNFRIKEILNCCIEITNPLDRLIYVPERKMNLAYAFGELLWYLSGSNSLEPMEYYSSRMREFSDDGETLNSAYGYRIFGSHGKIGFDQWENVQRILREDPDSRQAIIHLHTPNNEKTKDEVCTLSLQFLIREGKLIMITNMRSNDIVLGFTYDIFAFTMFQEMMANELGLELGTYYHNVGSMHIYQKNFNLLDKHTFIKSVPMQRNCMCLDQYEDLVAYERLLRNANSNAYMLEKFADYNDDVKYSFEPDYLDILKYALVLWAIKRKIKNPIDRIQMANKVINEARLIDENYVDLLVNGCNMFGNDDIKIIVEGIDGAGKSTLVNALSEALAKEGIMANAQHCKKPTNNFRYFDNYFNSTMNDANVIFDRFFFTEWIYSIVMDRERFLSPRDAQELMGICMDKKFTFVFFVFDDEGLKEVCSRMDKQDYEDFASNDRAYRQNCFYETTTKLLQSKGANVIVIDNPNYDVQEQIIRIIGRDALC